MIITGEKLRLYYYQCSRSGGCLVNLPEIEKELYGYELTPGQIIYAIRYSSTNEECYYRSKILAIKDEGLLILEYWTKKEMLLPFNKKFNIPKSSKNLKECELYLEPCEHLFEKNNLIDILNGNIDKEDYKNAGKYPTSLTTGIWYKHGGWRTYSDFEDNLKHFIKLGQISLM